MALKHAARFQTLGGWGYVDPAAFAFDLFGPAAWKAARKSGVLRYGAVPSSGDDSRPIAPKYRHVYNVAFNRKDAWEPSDADAGEWLLDARAPFGGDWGISFSSTLKENPKFWTLAANLGKNEAVAFRALIYEVAGEGEEVKGHIWHYRVGSAGAGVLFQVRDGQPEIARLSSEWTRGLENQLRLLWALKDPTPAQETDAENLQKQIYSSFETLSLERSTGRDNWLSEPFFVTLLPDPLGALHVILGSGDAVMIEPLEEQKTLWNEGASVEVGQTGGVWKMQHFGVRMMPASMEFGPYFSASDIGAAQFSVSSVSQLDADGQPIAGVTFEKTEDEAPAPDPNEPPDPEGTAKKFGFKATFTSSDARYGAWLFGLSARLENGPRTGLDDSAVSFDSAGEADSQNGENQTEIGQNRDKKPICECSISVDESNRRSATVNLRDISGRTLASIPGGIDGLVGRVANLAVNDEPALTQALITRGHLNNAAHFAAQVNGQARRQAQDVSKAVTSAELIFEDGHAILEETLCNPPVISDGKRLGFAIRQRLKVAGYNAAEMARVPADFGPLLPKAAPGESWAVVSDSGESVSSSIEGLLDRFGLGLRFYQDTSGVWVLEKRPTQSIASFVSDSSKNDPEMKRPGGSRRVILSPLDWERDNSNFFNIFRVIGGIDGKEIVRDFVDKHSMQSTTGVGGGAAQIHARWVGRPRVYPTLRDAGLRTVGQVLYALRSLVDRYNRVGKFATFVTYFVGHFYAGDIVTVDGIKCEIVSYEADVRADRMQIRVREVL